VPAGAKRKRQYQERQERDRTDKAGQVRRQRDGGGALNAADRMGLDERRSARHDPSSGSATPCFGIGLRSVIGRRGGTASCIETTATITAEKGPGGIRIRSAHLHAVVSGLSGVSAATLREIGAAVETECTISAAIRGSVEITHEVIVSEIQLRA
jgi:hypothetical protein